MQLTFSGAPEIAAQRPVVWSRVLDPQVVAGAAPGVEAVEQVDPTHFRVVSAFGVGSLKLRFHLDVELFDLTEPERFSMRAHGQAAGSMVDVVTNIQLEPLDAARTRLHWAADTTFSGTVASVGARLLEGTARRLTEKFWNDFAQRIGEGNHNGHD